MGTEDHERITIETERILLIAQGQVTRGRCENCGHEVGIHVANAAQTLSASSKEIAVQEKPRFVRTKNKFGTYLKSLLRSGAWRKR